MHARHCLVLLPLLCVAPAGHAASDAIALGRQCAIDFHQGSHEAMWSRMSATLQGALGTPAALEALRLTVIREAGSEVAVQRERTERSQGVRTYTREARFTRASVVLRCLFDDADRIAGFEVRPLAAAAPSPYLEYQTRARLRLPFEGEWHTLWGGRSIDQNYHAATADQRFAYDFLRKIGASTHAADGKRLQDYYCWDQKILAPAAGTVVTARDGVADNAPGVMNAAVPPGNHAVLDLGNGEFALLGHLKRSSILVSEGERVDAGQQVGRCGNSGNSSEPHLHFHLQTSPRSGEGDGLPAYFNDYEADGMRVQRGEPVRGQAIRP